MGLVICEDKKLAWRCGGFGMELWCQFGHRFEYGFELVFGALESTLDEEVVVGLRLCVVLSRHGKFSSCRGDSIFDFAQYF